MKDGQPHPASYLSFDENKASPLTMSTYMPFSLKSLYLDVKALSVLFFWVILYCSSVSFSFKSFSFFGIFLVFESKGLFASAMFIWQYPVGFLSK